jgi:hypothetical protein
MMRTSCAARSAFNGSIGAEKMAARSENQVLNLLRRRGARRLRQVRFRANRSTIWSLTQDGTVLNLHVAYRTAPLEMMDHFAVIAKEARQATSAYRAAAAEVRDWDGLTLELRRVRRDYRLKRAPLAKRRRRRRAPHDQPGPCCGTSEQRVYLRRLYRYLNRTRFDGRLPDDVPLRLSNRMTTRVGQLVPGVRNGVRFIVELALNVDLMLEGNGRERIDTLVHEMAHGAEWLFDGEIGHGPGWRHWARYAGCSEKACADEPIRRRVPGHPHATRVPRLPAGAWTPAAA